jgi:hypothetical protein
MDPCKAQLQFDIAVAVWSRHRMRFGKSLDFDSPRKDQKLGD